MRICCGSVADGNITIFPEADATHMDLLSGATWSVLEHSFTKWTCSDVSGSEGCIDLSGPVPATLDINHPDQKCPVLIIGRALQLRRWTPVHREVTHARGGPLELWEMGIGSVWSGETASFFVLFCCEARSSRQSRAQLCTKICYVMLVQRTGCQHKTWRTCQNQRSSPWPMQTEMRTRTPPMKPWSPGRTLLSTRCRWAMTSSNLSKAHALPAARRRHHQHVRIMLRKLLAVPSPCRGISEDASCDMKTVRRCGSIGVSCCSATSTRRARPAERSASSTRDSWCSTNVRLTFAVWVRLGESVPTKSGLQGAELNRAISVSSQREWLQNNNFMWKTAENVVGPRQNSVNTPTTPHQF